jgi:hypothetical protein
MLGGCIHADRTSELGLYAYLIQFVQETTEIRERKKETCLPFACVGRLLGAQRSYPPLQRHIIGVPLQNL